ncbi:MAG: carboxypeptidase-like regulatory domain-containing protein [Flavobacteriales bacterium]|nr:carboxypeptidase-like regulatory domain-containing protein [Flavobacteriales bacterium]
MAKTLGTYVTPIVPPCFNSTRHHARRLDPYAACALKGERVPLMVDMFGALPCDSLAAISAMRGALVRSSSGGVGRPASWRAGPVMRRSVLLAFALCLVAMANAQRTRIFGRVLDAATLEPVPFAVAVFKGSNVGADADSSGRFYLETNRGYDSLVVSMLGYRSQVVPVSVGATDEIDVELMPDAMELGAFTISRPNENPALPSCAK